MVKLLTEPWGRKMHSDYYNMVFGEKLTNILYEANSQFFYERNVIEEAVNALFCEREIINNKNIIKKLMFFLSDVNHTKKDVVQSALNIIIDITSGDI
ncbi:biofilm development regulator YmgB/AriR family protein [Escherichia coli]|uniref:biofilm development regulator YmgB/AriR family protein n=2 Tax=Escherichia coli TaxID=562 RepID=UPI001CDAE79B|nr:biofilm development regulator YmgB/AriR family protein [Escherichia coli]